MRILETALQYATRGWHVLPLKPKNKHPLTPHGVKDATTDPETIRRWWKCWPDANIGIACGPSRLLVVDLDGPEALTAWADLAQRLNIPYHTLTAHTGGGGIHLFYRVPDGLRIGNSAGRLGPHIDTRGDGGYIVAPPSIHPSGRPYVWEDPDREILDLPPALADLLIRTTREEAPPSPPPARPRDLHPYAEKALREEVEAVRCAPVGTRNDTLNKAAFSLGQLVGAGILDRMTVEDELAAAARAAGLEEREIQATLRSGLEAGIRQPRLPEKMTIQDRIALIAQVEEEGCKEAILNETAKLLAGKYPPQIKRKYVKQLAKAAGISEAEIQKLIQAHKGAETDTAERYCVANGCICVVRWDEDGNRIDDPLCNFTAEIAEDVARDDGETIIRYYTITGQINGTPLQPARVEARRFPRMDWVGENWGARAIIRAGRNIPDYLREAIQTLSKPTMRHVYTHTGWREINGKRVYLTAAGAVGLDGITVELDRELERYRLPLKPEDPVGAMSASLRFLEVGPETVTIPLWAAVYLAPLAEIIPPAFTIWLYGMSGALKSTMAALALSHYGPFTDKTLPAQWNSTANFLERIVFLAKDALLVIDDFAPQSDPHRAREMEQNAARIVRAVGNQAGRGRLTGDLSIRTTYRPRGMVISTGEQVPDGLSETARMFTVEMRRGEVDIERLTIAQKEAIRYPHALAGYILWLADNWEHLARTLPNTLQEARSQILESYAGHLRIPETMATLFIGLATGLAYAQEIGALTESQTQEWKERGWAALWDMAIGQSARIERERPSLIFLEVLSTLVAQGKARLYPKDSDKEFIPEPGTDLVGWYDEDFIYLLPEAAYHAVARFLREEGRHFPVKERALWKYLFEEGYLLRNEGDPHYTRRIRRGDNLHRVIQIIRSAAAEYFPATSMPSPIIPL